MEENFVITASEKQLLPKVNGWREIIDLPVANSPKPWNSQELEDILRSSINSVVDQALLDNGGEIHTTLSGGVDSSLCLAITAELCPHNTVIHTYTVGGSQNHPDIQFARSVAKLYNTTHHEKIIDQREKLNFISAFKYHYGDSAATLAKIERGDVNIWIAYQGIFQQGAKTVIAHDGIDELLGGYYAYNKAAKEGTKQLEDVFEDYWQRLGPEHLEPLEQTANHFGITILFPYLQESLVRYIAGIPVIERASSEFRKKPLKDIAERYFKSEPRLSQIPERRKYGFISALQETFKT